MGKGKSASKMLKLFLVTQLRSHQAMWTCVCWGGGGRTPVHVCSVHMKHATITTSPCWEGAFPVRVREGSPNSWVWVWHLGEQG